MQLVSLFLILYNFGANLANDIYLPSLPLLTKLFDSSTNILQLTMTVWFAGVAMPQLFFGPLTDRYGRRPILFAGGICFLLSTLICAAAGNVWVLIIARFFQGIGVCSLNVATFSILSDLFAYKKRTQIMNKITACGTLAPLIGPIIGGYMLAYLGWRSTFILIFVFGFTSLLGLWYKLPESNMHLDPHALNPKNIFRNYSHLFKDKNLLKHLVPYCLILGGLIAYLVAAPFIVISNLHVPPQWFGYTQLPVFLVFVLGSIYVNYLKDENAIQASLVLGIKLVLSAGFIMPLMVYFFGGHLLFFIVPMMIYALGFSLCAAPLASEVMNSGGVAKGYTAALLGFGMSISCMLASLALGFIYNGTVLSVALLLGTITTLAASGYFVNCPAALFYLFRSRGTDIN